MPDIELGSVPFKEAIAHFRAKLNIPSPSWDAMVGEINAKGFTIAGATKADLLGDIRAGVDQAIAEGTTIQEFRKQFDAAVQKHGWTYNGKRGWRTRVIYDNNLRSARMAGRWEQVQRTADRRPYLQYLTAGDARVRPEHAAWDQRVLRIDDPWWRTHYPPNGWGCRCTVRTLSDRQVDRLGLSVASNPDVQTTERVNAATGEAFGPVPVGIDVGWDFNVGQAWLGPEIAFGQKLMQLPRGMRTPALAGAQSLAPTLQKPFSTWFDKVSKQTKFTGELKTVGYLSPRVVDALADRGHTPVTAVVTVSDRDILHTIRDATSAKQLARDRIKQLPTELANAETVLWDKRDPALVYVIGTADENRQGKLVIRVNFKTKTRSATGDRESVYTNTVRTAGLVQPNNLLDERYEVVEGELRSRQGGTPPSP